MRQKVDPAVLKPQVLQKCLHDAGLLEDGVVVRSLGEGSPDTREEVMSADLSARLTPPSHPPVPQPWPHPEAAYRFVAEAKA